MAFISCWISAQNSAYEEYTVSHVCKNSKAAKTLSEQLLTQH
ncbi:low density lipoprotein receptor-related protein associated protein 1, isoform CRA_b [Rattus norvegicus]|uniref:Low density lipoprotein receptor-related protein associated protein 1, isoform CRA_b n=1 Tax=Rattus norvegicus TaxID=10116 RepID=A6IK08_RAT|nr:low density lipoprotein receptor-related protein associated protein 1, isoform CRA_b [Rattus norvegicus]